MKSKSNLPSEPDSESRRTGKQEISPVRSSANLRNRITTRTNGGRRNGPQAVSPTPSSAARTGPTGPGRTPQTKRRELSLTQNEKNSPTGSPRNRDSVKPQTLTRKPTQTRSKTDSHPNGSNEESTRKSSNSSQDSGIGRDVKSARPDRPKSGHSGAKTRSNPTIRTISPETVEIEVSNRKKFEELCDVKNVEQGIVKVPPELLEDLIHKGNIESYYEVESIPVASGLFATVRKCTHKETGVEYAAKFSSRVRCGVDCTTEVLHEIALLSACAESSKIVHLKDVFQNKHEIVLVLEYAPGGDFQSVLDDDMVPFEQDVQGFILQLLEALSYIHHRKIAHLDIKPQNIVLMSEFPNCELKLCDLEVSRVIQDSEQIREIIGTPDYVAPEILGMEPITLAADIWSLGVLAYVLLTGFSPFGGDTDQETLRNITTAPLDFPAELFEGVSEDAKDFITQCLDRNPKKRPTVQECFLHPWISQNAEPPSPSPLMLKIPAPDHFVSPQSGSEPAPGGGSRRSCQTCRDKITERKRYLSKSREAIFEKVANSNLKKSLSKSRERLCDMRLTLSKSRDYLNESKIAASRSQEKFYGFKSISKSQEVLSEALGGNMKRMVNGAVSDISPVHLPMNPRVYLDSPDSCDFVILPGSSVLMSHSDLMSLSTSSESIQTLTPSESGRSAPASSSTQTLPSFQFSESQMDHNSNAKTGKSLVQTLEEVSEEDCDENENVESTTQVATVYRREPRFRELYAGSETKTSRRKSSHEMQNTRTCFAKEEKNNINYETKQSMSRSLSADGLHNNNNNNNVTNKLGTRSETAEVAVQVNMSQCSSSPSIPRKERSFSKSDSSSLHEKSFNSVADIMDGNSRQGRGGSLEKRLGRGFSHDDTLGEESKRYSWREELERFRALKKPLGVSDLIDTFSNRTNMRKMSSADLSFSSLDCLQNKRRGSLQIQINAKELAKLSETAESEKSKSAAKLQRRKSTSAILAVRGPEVKMPGIVERTGLTPVRAGVTNPARQNSPSEKRDSEKDIVEEEEEEEEEKEDGEEEKVEGVTGVDEINDKGNDEGAKDDENKIILNEGFDNHQRPNKGRVYLEKVNERKRTWDYFEINHPKAISDKKLEQLKAKYTRRKTETCFQKQAEPTVDSNSNNIQTVKTVPPHTRTLSMPVIKGLSDIPRKNLDLAWDPLTGESVGIETESIDSGKGGEITRAPSVSSTDEVVRKISVCSILEENITKTPENKVDDMNTPRSNNFIRNMTESEQIIPGREVLECFIDPFTGQFITSQVSRQNGDCDLPDKKTTETKSGRNLRVLVPDASVLQQDDGIGSLPDTPTDTGKMKPLGAPPIGAPPLGAPTRPRADYPDSLHTDDGSCASLDEVVLRTRNTNSSASSSDRLSTISIDDSLDSHGRIDSNGNRRVAVGSSPATQRPRSNSGTKERAKATKVCTGSFSRGFERFRSESPVPMKNRTET